MTAVRLLPVALALAAVWAIRVYWWPFAPCRRCGGTGRNAGSNSRRWGQCRRCKGKGHRQVLGSRQVHKAVRALRSAAAKRRADR